MSDIKYKDFVLSDIAWGIAVFLSMLVYVMYYLWLYPLLSTVQIRQDLYSTFGSQGNLEIAISAPIYVANFQNSSMIISLRNTNSAGKSIRGIAVIKATLPKTMGRLIFNSVPQSEYKINFRLKPGESISHNVNLKLSDITSSCVDLSMEIQPVPNLPNNNEEFLVFLKTPIKWVGLGYDWVQKLPDSKCAKQVQNQEAYAFFHAMNYPFGAFAESTLSKLLVPPWSGLSSLALVFGVIWLLEHFILGDNLKANPSLRYGIRYPFFLFVATIVLLLFFSLGLIQIFKHINDRTTYFFVLIAISLFFVSFGWYVSWLYKQELKPFLTFVIPSIVIIVTLSIYLIYKIDYIVVYLLVLLFLNLVLIIIYLFSLFSNKQKSSPEPETLGIKPKDIDPDIKLQEIEKAYIENNLRELRRIINSSKLTDSQLLQLAKRRYEQRSFYLQEKVYGWGELLKEKESDYNFLRQSVVALLLGSSCPTVLPDPQQVLMHLLDGKIPFSDQNEWELDKLDNSARIIIQALEEMIASLTSAPPENDPPLSPNGPTQAEAGFNKIIDDNKAPSPSKRSFNNNGKKRTKKNRSK
jgi:hypothetical protein